MEAVRPHGGCDSGEGQGSGRVEAATRGDRVAAEGLLMEMLPRVRNLVRYLVRGDASVDDVAQEALVAVLHGLPTWRAQGPFEAWVDRIVARTTFAEIRRGRARRARLEAVGEDIELLGAGEPGPEDYLARRRTVEALDRLPDEQRQALVLHHVAGMSVPEIAAESGAPAETVRSRLRLGMRHLREIRGVPESEGDGE